MLGRGFKLFFWEWKPLRNFLPPSTNVLLKFIDQEQKFPMNNDRKSPWVHAKGSPAAGRPAQGQ